MENINHTMKKLVKNETFRTRYEKMKNEVLNHHDIQQFIGEHQDQLTKEMVDRSLIKLYEYCTQTKDCQSCGSVENCKNLMKGYQPRLVLTANSIDLQYERCSLKIKEDERKKHESFIQSLYVPKEILHASLGLIDLENGERLQAIRMAKEFIEQYTTDPKQKGIYFYGPFGVGKTFLLGAIANELAENNVASLIVYMPEFLREMKGSIGDQTLNEKIEMIKKAPILMLDDIGAETMSSWSRDEVLGTILQFRMLERLPTFFTSNFDFEQLQYHLTYSQRGDEEKIKAARIMERIRYLAIPVKVSGPNRRT